MARRGGQGRAELPPAEWDFVNAAGQRVKLEISTRMVEQGGKQVEVEGIARDITERKRLEREILEASNREQRRIGHDLHDGVCQQLAAINYRMDVLADQLQEKGDAASVEAEKIGQLINDTITQTRGVARGLVPGAPGGEWPGLGAGGNGRQRQQPLRHQVPLRQRPRAPGDGERDGAAPVLHRAGGGAQRGQTRQGGQRAHHPEPRLRPVRL